jgi:hypothetical protein
MTQRTTAGKIAGLGERKAARGAGALSSPAAGFGAESPSIRAPRTSRLNAYLAVSHPSQPRHVPEADEVAAPASRQDLGYPCHDQGRSDGTAHHPTPARDR